MNGNDSVLLLKALLLSTSDLNTLRYSHDKKKKGFIVSRGIGMALVYLMLAGYSFATCYGYGKIGIISSAPVLCALIISSLALVFTFIKSDGYLFNFKEYDMLMALPFAPKTVAACKFLYMYIKALPWYMAISVPMLIGYGYFERPSLLVYPVWIVLSLLLPVIPMLAASFLGFVIAGISSGFKKAHIVQTILMFAVCLAALCIQFVAKDLLADGAVKQTLESIASVTESAGRVYMPAGWFADSVTALSVPSMLLFVIVTFLLFTVVFAVVGRSYRNINSALKSHAAARNYKMTSVKSRSMLHAIVFKEFRRFTGSSLYMMQGGFGELLALLLGLAAVIFGLDTIADKLTEGASFDPYIVRPAIPMLVYLFIGMLATTVCSPSLEGKNYWIVQSLPIPSKILYQGKMLFNMYLSVPFMAVSTILLCISAKVTVLNTILYLILGFSLCCFSTTWGAVCGIRHMRLDWENEIEVLKQGAAVMIYLLPNMFACIGIGALAVFLGMRMDHSLLAITLIVPVAILSLICYKIALSLAQRRSC